MPSSSVWARPLPPVAAAALVAAVAVGVGAAYLALARSADPSTPSAPPLVRPPLPPGSYPDAPLAAGTPAPPLEAAGWLNGPYPGPDARTARLVVLDIWAGWCPSCRATAPGVLAAYHKYKDRGVAFVSLAGHDRDDVQAFADRFDIPWPCGYGATLESLARFGAYSADRMSAAYNPGYEVTPTIFILGPDGRVRWHDDQARPRHLTDVDTMTRNLDSAIERELAATPPPR